MPVGGEADRSSDTDQESGEPRISAPSLSGPLAGLLDDRLDLVLAGQDGRRRDGSRWDAFANGATMASTMADVKLDRSDPLELHKQVAAALRRAIADGEAQPGERLPPAKDLAAVMEVNTNTVLRALRTLRDEGLLEFRRGTGVMVAGERRRGEVMERAAELVSFARSRGYQMDELIDIIRQA